MRKDIATSKRIPAWLTAQVKGAIKSKEAFKMWKICQIELNEGPQMLAKKNVSQ